MPNYVNAGCISSHDHLKITANYRITLLRIAWGLGEQKSYNKDI